MQNLHVTLYWYCTIAYLHVTIFAFSMGEAPKCVRFPETDFNALLVIAMSSFKQVCTVRRTTITEIRCVTVI